MNETVCKIPLDKHLICARVWWLTAKRLWLISALSIRLCLSGSLVSDALSLPAKSTNHILHTQARFILKSVTLEQYFSAYLIYYPTTHSSGSRQDGEKYIHIIRSIYNKTHQMSSLTCHLSADLDV